MLDAHWLSAIYFYMLESLLEAVIICLVVQAVLQVRSLRSPVVMSRFLFLPLVIPVLLSPLLHLLFPQLTRLALIVQIENAFPFLERMREGSASLAPVLLAVFFFLFAFNLSQWLVIGLREALDSMRTTQLCYAPDCKVTLQRLAREFGVASPRLVLSERHPFSAYVFGWRYPIITLGREWFSRLDTQELEAVFAHELAHFRRGDNWLVLVAKVCRDLMFFNPLAYYIYGHLVAAREEAADDAALRVTRKPLALAACLLKFWQAQQPARVLSGSLSLASQPARLERRIRRLMTGGYDYQPARNWNHLFYGLSLVLTVVFSVV